MDDLRNLTADFQQMFEAFYLIWGYAVKLDMVGVDHISMCHTMNH